MPYLNRRNVAAFAAGLLLSVAAQPARAQTVKPLLVETYLLKDPSGTQLLRILKGTRVSVGATHDGWIAATIDGWVPAGAVGDGKRDGFDIGVTSEKGTTVRTTPGNGAAMAGARFGVLFYRVATQDGWVHVKRMGWLPQAAIVPPAPARVAAAPQKAAPPPGKTTAPPVKTAAPSEAAVSRTSVIAGASMSSEAGGPPVATLEAPLPADVVEHRGGWAHVRLDAWVRDGSLGNAPPPSGITGADVRAAPDKYVGQTVEWTVELLGIEKADELRPELPAGQPYLLARGPLPETGFVYVAIPPEEEESFRHLEPLTKIRIRATIRAGKSRFLPTPVLNFIRRLN